MKFIPHNKPTIEKEEIDAVVNALSNAELTLGTKVLEFEDIFSKYIGLESVASSSGTSSLHLALIAMGVGIGDEVILPSYTCAAVAYPVLYQQAKTVLVDVNCDFNLNACSIKNNINDKTKAVIVPHMFGYPADIQTIKEICDDKGVFLIEDCAQSLGALYDGKKVGTFGDISIFSFYATKLITSIQGGMLSTNNKEWIETVRDIRYHDQMCSTDDIRLKYSYMMSDVNASVGIEQLKKLNSFIERRREIANIYRDKILSVKHPDEAFNKKHVYSRYLVNTDHKDKIIQKLIENNINCTTMHSMPLHRRTIFSNHHNHFLNTDGIINTSLSLPIYPTLKDEDVLYISDMFNKIRSNYD